MNRSLEKIIFIDRDGVINHDPIGDYIKTWADFRFCDGVLEALAQLTQYGFKIVIVSNQAGIGDGVYPKSELKEITQKMIAEIERHGAKVEKIYYCLHGKQAHCNCRKPKTGLFEQAAKDYSFEKNKTYLIGDKLTDIEAGKRFGLKTIMVMTGHGKLDKPRITEASKPDLMFENLQSAVHYLMNAEPH